MGTLQARVTALREVGAFSACSRPELERIARLVDDLDVDAGDVLMREGAPGRQSFVVVEGQAAITVGGHPVATVGPGSFLGEMVLVDHGDRNATVTAVTAMRLLVLGPQTFAALCDTPTVTRHGARR